MTHRNRFSDCRAIDELQAQTVGALRAIIEGPHEAGDDARVADARDILRDYAARADALLEAARSHMQSEPRRCHCGQATVGSAEADVVAGTLVRHGETACPRQHAATPSRVEVTPPLGPCMAFRCERAAVLVSAAGVPLCAECDARLRGERLHSDKGGRPT